jgi:Tfp pilus assembly protein PilF
VPRPLLAALALLSVLVVTGCSGDDADKEPSSAASSSASLSAADTLVQTALQQLDAGDDAKARATFENVRELDPANVYAQSTSACWPRTPATTRSRSSSTTRR